MIWISLCLNIVSTIGLLCVIFWKSYITEKGKNAATKEDIEEITKKIESVRATFNTSNEVISQHLAQLHSTQKSHRETEKQFLIDFYSSYITWLYQIQSIELNKYNKANLQSLIEKRSSLENYFNEISIANAKMSLVVRQQDIIALADQMLQKIIAYKYWSDTKTLSYQFLLERKILINSEFTALIKNLDQNRNRAEAIAAEDTFLREEIKQADIAFGGEKINGFSECIKVSSVFAQNVKNYLFSHPNEPFQALNIPNPN